MKKTLFLIVLWASFWLTSCKQETPSISLAKSNLEKVYYFDYTNAYSEGFVIPSTNKDLIDSLKISIKLENFEEQKIYYKIYYQNEAYKFPELLDSTENLLSRENFYGSWENVSKEFLKHDSKQTPLINTSFRVVGNPRNEALFYGKNNHKRNYTEEELTDMINHIMNDKEWFKSVNIKAQDNGRDLEHQLSLDAEWALNENAINNPVNNRWKRNPRPGKYSLLIVVTNKEGLDSIPKYIQNISLRNNDNQFMNPYYYFLHGEGRENKNIKTHLIQNAFSLKAEVPIDKGIYVDTTKYSFDNYDYLNKNVNYNNSQYYSSAFEFHYSGQADLSSSMNIPVKADFLGNGYSKSDYDENKKTPKSKRIETFFKNSNAPGETFGIDTSDNSLWFKNPGNKQNEFKKENVGIKTRHGLTYGKYTFKIKMANILTHDNVWTGLTNALWLVKESNESWNQRRICNGEGFMPFYGAGKNEQRVPSITYSEIDFEILKTAEVWPYTSYPNKKEHFDPQSHDDKVMVTCTNWDMACMQPDSFGTGLKQIKYEEDYFNIHRWDHFYNALTSKHPEKDKTLFSDEYYYFQIEWKPTEIIWRIGPEKNNLQVVGYMNDEVTTIPNNQMIAVVTQEYHFSEWWPKSPYKQEDLPFPKESLKGKLFSLEIE